MTTPGQGNPLRSRMFLLGAASLGIFFVGMLLAFWLALKSLDASSFVSVMGQLSLVAGIVTGGASAVNAVGEARKNGGGGG